MSMLWVCELTREGEIRLGAHIAFGWRDSNIVETACGRELGGPREEWVDADTVVAPNPPRLTLCRECAAMTVAQLYEQYGLWMRGETR